MTCGQGTDYHSDLNRQDMSWEWDANWLLISDGISSHNNKTGNGRDYGRTESAMN